MSSIFCCTNVRPYKNQTLAHESRFQSFMSWSSSLEETAVVQDNASPPNDTFVVQVVRQINYGPLESKRYFVKTSSDEFIEVKETWLIDQNFQKLNSYKNLKCNTHNRFFELNVYEKDPVNKHHWRVNIARPATEIDL